MLSGLICTPPGFSQTSVLQSRWKIESDVGGAKRRNSRREDQS